MILSFRFRATPAPAAGVCTYARGAARALASVGLAGVLQVTPILFLTTDAPRSRNVGPMAYAAMAGLLSIMVRPCLEARPAVRAARRPSVCTSTLIYPPDSCVTQLYIPVSAWVSGYRG